MEGNPAPVKPTIGRIVHYRTRGEKDDTLFEVPAMITATPETLKDTPAGSVDLIVFYPRGAVLAKLAVRQEQEGESGVENRWHWPERV